MSNYCVDIFAVGGGGGGASCYGGGGGGGGYFSGTCYMDDNNLYVFPGCGGACGCGANNCCNGVNGGYTCILYTDNSPFLYVKGGVEGFFCGVGGNSGTGCLGACKRCICGGGGGAGAGGGGCMPASTNCGGVGGPGICGMAGGGGASSRCNVNQCIDGGGKGGTNTCCACSGVNGGGGGGAFCNKIPGAGGNGLVDICYLTDGTNGFTTATGGNCCFTCNGYCVHRFTSDGTFTIVS